MPTISFKVTDEDAREIRREARRLNLSVSEFLRRRALGESPQNLEVKTEICQWTGATIFSGSPALHPLTTESVREMLSDFP